MLEVEIFLEVYNTVFEMFAGGVLDALTSAIYSFLGLTGLDTGSAYLHTYGGKEYLPNATAVLYFYNLFLDVIVS